MAVIYNSGSVAAIRYGDAAVAHLRFHGIGATSDVEVPFGGGGPTELDFTLTSDLTQPLYITQSAPNAVTVDWGDGTTESPTDLAAALSHTWEDAGVHKVRIACADGETWSPGAVIASGSSTTNYGLCGQGGKSGTYPTLTDARFGAGMRLDTQNAFFGCTSLTSVTIPDSITSIGNYAFESCIGLILNTN